MLFTTSEVQSAHLHSFFMWHDFSSPLVFDLTHLLGLISDSVAFNVCLHSTKQDLAQQEILKTKSFLFSTSRKYLVF